MWVDVVKSFRTQSNWTLMSGTVKRVKTAGYLK